MANDNFLNLLTKLSEALLSSKKEQKSAYKPENAQKQDAKPSFGGDFSSKSQTVISPKQSVVEMLRNHERLSKQIDTNARKDG